MAVMRLKRAIKEDIDFLEASNGEKAIEIIEKTANEISLVITDINMPKANGNEVARIAFKYEIPVITFNANINAVADDVRAKCAGIYEVGLDGLKQIIEKIKENPQPVVDIMFKDVKIKARIF